MNYVYGDHLGPVAGQAKTAGRAGPHGRHAGGVHRLRRRGVPQLRLEPPGLPRTSSVPNRCPGRRPRRAGAGRPPSSAARHRPSGGPSVAARVAATQASPAPQLKTPRCDRGRSRSPTRPVREGFPRAIPRRDLARRAARRIGPPSRPRPQPAAPAAVGGAAARLRRAPAVRRRTPAGPARRRRRSGAAGGGRPPGVAGRRAAVRRAGGRRAAAAGTARPRPAGARAARARRSSAASSAEDRRLGVLGGLFVLLGVFIGVVYASTDGARAPTRSPDAQTTVVYYSDGTHRDGPARQREPHQRARWPRSPKPAQDAVLAAENRSFYTDPGISFTGIVRAACNNVTGGSTQGGSTITQQYVKNAILTELGADVQPQVQGALPRGQAGQQLLEGPDPRELPEHHLLRPRRLRHRGRREHLLRRARPPQLTAAAGRRARRPDPQPLVLRPRDATRRRRKDRWGARARRMVGAGLARRPRTARRRCTRRCCPRPAPSLGIPTGPQGLIVQQAHRRAGAARATPRTRSTAAACGSPRRCDKRAEDAAINAVNTVMKGEPDEPARRRWSPSTRRPAAVRRLLRRPEGVRRRRDRLRPGAAAARARR